ncbi:MAG: hypothetical protein ABW182_01870 [Sphingomonas sp.]
MTGQRYGEALTPAESEFAEDEIAGQGADTVQEVLDRLKPFIAPGSSAEDEPVLLINGRPAEGDRSVLSYPPEALSRVAVLKPDAASRYGYPSGRRVVNLVLKKRFSAITVEAGLNGATAGGQYGGELSAGRVSIAGATRWNVQARIARDGALLKQARAVPRMPGEYDSVGFVTGIGSGELDPALSEAAGFPVTSAAIPAATGDSPQLADFVATADRRSTVDPNAFETLLPARQSLSLAAGVTRPIGAFSASLSLNAGSSRSDGQRGLPMTSITLPAGNPWSPFEADVLLSRPLDGTRALQNRNRSNSIGATLGLTGRIAGWQTAASIGYAKADSESLLELGVDTPRAQALLRDGAAGFDPYGPWDARLLASSTNSSRSERLMGRLSGGKTMFDLPAGPATVTVAANAGRNASWNRTSLSADPTGLSVRRVRSQADGQLSIALPLSRSTAAGPAPLGDIAVELYAGGQVQSGSGTQGRAGGGITWSPFPIVQLRAVIDRTETAPTVDQLDGAPIVTVNRLFDFVRQESVDVAWTVGGNPALNRGRRQSLLLAALIRPLADQRLMVNFGYRATHATDGTAPFPELTPAIEAAFPERVTRDAGGTLVAVDARAINIARDDRAELTSGIALRLGSRPHRPGATGPISAPLQISVSLTHLWRLRNELLIRPGLPVLDLLGGDSGQSRHSVSLQATVARSNAGLTLSGNWNSGARLDNRLAGGGNTRFRFRSTAILNLAGFFEPAGSTRSGQGPSWLRNLRFSLEVRNLTNSYRRVTLADGQTPDGYTRDEIDPLGRTLRLAIRKRF